MLIVRRRLLAGLGVIVILALAYVLLLAGQSVMLRSFAALLAEAVVPGCLLAWLLVSGDQPCDWIEFSLYSLGLGLSAMVLGTFFLHLLPGPLSQHLILLAFGSLSLVLLILVLLSRRVVHLQRSGWTRRQALVGLTVLIVAMALRLPMMGYSEFQGDEGRAVLRAAEVLQGNDEVLLLHKKGPVEILLPAGLYAATQRLTEWTARLPFSLANLAFLVALMVVGRRLLSPWAGLIASGVLAVDGFMIGFSRLVQYQSIVLLMTAVVILAVLRATKTDHLHFGSLLAAALMAAVALLAHYEGIFFVAPAGLLIWQWTQRTERAVWVTLRELALPLICGMAIVAAFYLPFVLHPHFGETAVYLGQKRVGQGLFYSNLADFFERASFYSSAYYALALIFMLATGAAGVLWRRYQGRVARIALGALAALWLVAFFVPSLWQVGGVNLTVLLFGVTLVAVWRCRLTTGQRAALVWLASNSLLYFFMMTKVHTHYYVALPAWSLLVGQMGYLIWKRVSGRRLLQPLALFVAVGFWSLSIGYGATVFLRQTPEFKFSYPQAKPALYWSPFASPPRGGYFGFPYRTAWKAIGVLYDQGILRGAYDSNQEDLVTNWYTRGALRCPGSDLYVVARDLENPHAVPPEMLDGTFHPKIEVTRAGEAHLWVFERGYQGPLQSYAFESLAPTFDSKLSAPVFRVGAPLDEPFSPQHLTNARFGEDIVLAGWSIDQRLIAPGGEAMLTLYWRSLQATSAGYKVFGSLGDGEPLALIDSVPACGQSPTYRWLPGEEIVDRHIVAVQDSASDAVLPLRVGMYDQGTADRLLITGPDGAAVGKTLHLADLRVGHVVLAESMPAASDAATFGQDILVSPVPQLDLQVRPGEAIEFDINWYAQGRTDKSLTVFVHCLGSDGRQVGQIDTLPRGGALPTSAWEPGERIDDHYRLEIDAGAPAGACRLVMGLYDSSTGLREDVALLGEPQADGLLEIGQVRVLEDTP